MSVMLANAGAEDRRELDYYPTPQECTVALMQFIENIISVNDLSCCEPACGEGHMSEVLKRYFRSVESFDIRDTGYGLGNVDYLAGKHDSCSCLITNPPFALSESFIRKSLSEGRKIVAMLLKSQYWHAKKRFELFDSNKPSFVLPLTWRPDFYFGQKSGSPTMEVLWTVWIDGIEGAIYQPLKKPCI